MKIGRYMRRLPILMLLVVIFCGCETSSLHRGYRWYRRGAYEQSIKTLTYYLEHSSDCDGNKEERAAGFFYRGLAKSNMGVDNEACTDYTEALQRSPNFFYASFNMGVCYIRQRQYELAFSMLRKSWESVQKAGRGELDGSMLWNRSVFFRDREYCFYYYGIAIVLSGSIDELGVLLHEVNEFVFQEKKAINARDVFKKIVSQEITAADGRQQVELWLKDMENRRHAYME